MNLNRYLEILIILLLFAVPARSATDPEPPMPQGPGNFEFAVPKENEDDHMKVRYADMSGYWLALDATTPVKGIIYNHGDRDSEDLRLRVETDVPWLKLAPVGPVEKYQGHDHVWDLGRVAGGGKKEFSFEITVLDSVKNKASGGGSGGSGGTSKDKEKSTSKKTRVRDQGSILLTMWNGGEEAGRLVDDKKGPARGMVIAPTRCWRMKYIVRAATEELARKPQDMEWHLVEMTLGDERDFKIDVTNLNKTEPLKSVTALPLSDQWYVALGKQGWIEWLFDESIFDRTEKEKKEMGQAEADKTSQVAGVPGLVVIKPGASDSFTVPIFTAPHAYLGNTASVRLVLKTSTTGTEPNPWEPYLLVKIVEPEFELPGNFEANLYYNLPPLKGDMAGKKKPDPNDDQSTWFPVPRGTKISVTQIYKFRCMDGSLKDAESFVGFGYVADDDGYFRCDIRPQVQRNVPIQLRIVADTIAKSIRYKSQKSAKRPVEIVTDLIPGQARVATTPFGSRPFRNISNVFQVVPGKEENGEVREAPEVFYKIKDPGEGHPYIKKGDVLIPYFGYEVDIDPDKKPGIVIEHEGELTTDGVISPFGFAQLEANARVSGAAAGGLGSGVAGARLGAEMGENQAEKISDIGKVKLGFIYHNHNELLHILSGLTQAQDFLKQLRFFRDELTDAKTKTVKPGRPLPGVIAYWKKSHVPDFEDTGYAWVQYGKKKEDGKYRLVVQGGEDDPDARDLGLILRGYGAAIRKKFWEPDPDEETNPLTPNYEYRKRTTIDRAWREGFDIFFAACALNSPKVLNEVYANKKENNPNQSNEAAAGKTKSKAEERSVNLVEIINLAREAQGGDIYKEPYTDVRGADNAVAVAAGLYAVAGDLGPSMVLDWILEKKGASLMEFLEWLAKKRPAALSHMIHLGLCPRVSRWPSAASIHEEVNPYNTDILLGYNDMLKGDKPIKAVLKKGTEGSEAIQHEFKVTKEKPAVLPFMELKDRKKGSKEALKDKKIADIYYWTIETVIDDKHKFQWPVQSMLTVIPTVDASNGLKQKVGNNGSIESAEGFEGRVRNGSARSRSIFDGRTLMGGEIHRIECLPLHEDGDPGPFPISVKLTLGWNDDEDPGQATPGIYFLNPRSEKWELAGSTRVGTNQVMAMITESGNYALLMDQQVPRFEETEARPNPFISSLGDRLWSFQAKLSEPCEVTMSMQNAEGQVVRKLIDAVKYEAGLMEVTWDGKDAGGELVPDGTYHLVAEARDTSGLESKPFTQAVMVFNGFMGSLAGKIVQVAFSNEIARIDMVGTTVGGLCEDDGSFELYGVPSGEHRVEFQAEGKFDEVRTFKVDDGDDVVLPPVTLTHVAVTGLVPSAEIFTPDGDGQGDYVTLSFTQLRDVPMDIEIFDEEDERVTALITNTVVEAGPVLYVWNGEGDKSEILPSGWYTVRLTAYNRDEAIPQGEIKVLLDRGIIHHAHAIPGTFTPNDDGFEDQLEINFLVERASKVTFRILHGGGGVLTELATELDQEAGWSRLDWDGRGADGKMLPDGKYQFEVRSFYLSGHESKVVRGEFGVDAKPPEIGEMMPVNGSILNTGTPTFTVKILSERTDIDPDQLKFKIDENTVLADGYDATRGLVTFTPKTSLGAGVHIAIAYAQDWAGNYAPPQAVSFKVVFGENEDEPFSDRAPPEILELLPEKDATLYTDHPLIFARVRDLVSGIDAQNVNIKINGKEVPNTVRNFIPGKSGEAWDYYYYDKAIVLYDPLQGEIRYVSLTPMQVGRNHVSLQVMDRRGNVSKPVETLFNVVVDHEAPVISDLLPTGGAVLGKPELTVTAKVTDTGASGLDLETLQLKLNGEPVAVSARQLEAIKSNDVLSVSLSPFLERDTQYQVALNVRDRAGNLSETAVTTFEVVADGDPPRIDLIAPKPDLHYKSHEFNKIMAALYDVGQSGLDIDTVELVFDGEPVPMFGRHRMGETHFLLNKGFLTFEAKRLPKGRHVVEIRCRDKAGNIGREVVASFYID